MTYIVFIYTVTNVKNLKITNALNERKLQVGSGDNQELTFRQLTDIIDKVSRDMLAAGVHNETIIAVWCSNCLEMVIVSVAAWKIGAAIAMIGASLTPGGWRFVHFTHDYCIAYFQYCDYLTNPWNGLCFTDSR